MLRLKASKTSLYKLVSRVTQLPILKLTWYSKVPRVPSYFLEWRGGYRAYLTTIMGRPMLSIAVYDVDGREVSRDVHNLTVVDLRSLGMVEEYAPKGAGATA